MSAGNGASRTQLTADAVKVASLLSVNNIEVIYDHVILVLNCVSLRVP
jgi:hypothetical protein